MRHDGTARLSARALAFRDAIRRDYSPPRHAHDFLVEIDEIPLLIISLMLAAMSAFLFLSVRMKRLPLRPVYRRRRGGVTLPFSLALTETR